MTIVFIMIGIVIGSFGVFSFAAQSTEARKQGSGRMVRVGCEIYEDAGASIVLDVVDWGLVDTGDVVTQDAYIKNTGNKDAVLSLATENWSPTEYGTYFTVEWDYDGSTLVIDAVVTVTFTFTVPLTDPPDVASDFTHDIVVTATSV